MKTALLVIDVQNDFCPGGRLAVPEGDQVVPLCNTLLQRADHAVLTQDWHPPAHGSFASAHPDREPFDTVPMPYGRQVLWPDHCVQGTDGADFHPHLDRSRAQLIVRKGFRPEIDSYSAFFANDRSTPTGLTGYLREREVERLVLCGLALDYCVCWSALDARKLGFEVAVVRDATRAIDQNGTLEKALQRMRDAGVTLTTADEVAL